jgi:Holliday junction resolvase
MVNKFMKSKSKGYRVERKIRIKLEKNGWMVVRSGGSLGEADLVCFKNGKCFFLQIKSSRKDKLYYYGYMKDEINGFPFYVVVDFGYGDIEVFKPTKILEKGKGMFFDDFFGKN